MPTLVQSSLQQRVDASGATSFNVTLTGTVAGNALVALFAVFDNNATWTVDTVGDAGNIWTTRVGYATAATRIAVVAATAVNITGGDRTITISLAGTSGAGGRYLTYGAQEWSGVATSAAEDTWDENSEVDISTLDVTAGPITTTDANDLLVGIAGTSNTDATMNWASPTSWTNSYRENDNNLHMGMDAGYWLPGAIQTTYSAGWTHDNAANEGCAVMVALKPSAGGMFRMPLSRPFPFKPGSPRQRGLR